MPITIAALAAKLSRVTIALGDGDTITIFWRVGLMNQETTAMYMAIAVPETGPSATLDEARDSLAVVEQRLNAFLVRLVQSWDIVDEDGVMFPITIERLPELAYVWRNKIMNAIMSDAQAANVGETGATEISSGAHSVAS